MSQNNIYGYFYNSISHIFWHVNKKNRYFNFDYICINITTFSKHVTAQSNYKNINKLYLKVIKTY